MEGRTQLNSEIIDARTAAKKHIKEAVSLKQRMTPESKGIRYAELLSMSPKTAEKIEQAHKKNRCPECGGRGVEKMDAYPKLVCPLCGRMFDKE